MTPRREAQDVQTIRTLRIEARRLHQILDELDSTDIDASQAGGQRYRYRASDLPIRLDLSGASEVMHLAPTRWISNRGLAFLHGSYVHQNISCAVRLTTLYGTSSVVQGTARSCRYIESGVHEVELEFDRPIDTSHFCPDAVTCRVLVVDDDPLMARVVLKYLASLNAQADHAENGQKGIELATQNHYDVILMDINMPEMSGLEAVHKLREDGYPGTIVAMTAQEDFEAEQQQDAASFDDRMIKPIDRSKLAGLLESLRSEPVFSKLRDDPAMSDVINSFVEELRTLAQKLRKASQEQDKDAVQSIAKTLRAQGASVGFDTISALGSKIEHALSAADDISGVRNEIEALVRLCLQARSAARIA